MNLVKEIKKGNQRAFDKAYEEYHSKLYQYIFRHTQSSYYAEETVQLTFIKLWEKREWLSDQFSISAQIFRIAKSTLIDLLRKEKIRSTQTLSDSYISVSKEDAKIIVKDELKHVLHAIDELPAQNKEVFKLSRFDNLSHKEIGAQLSISTKTVENHIAKALKYLRKNIPIFSLLLQIFSAFI